MIGVYSIENAVQSFKEECFEFMDHEAVLLEYRQRMREEGYDIVRALLDVNRDIIYAQSRV